jgi:ERCC4-related helicase
MRTSNSETGRLREFPWLISYRTSTLKSDGSTIDILHDFYIPALKRSIRYDRVAGFFRSTSLAAAAQGFSALVGKEGRARFIVGADLDPEDVRAILEGSSERLADALGERLAGSTNWPESVANGVQLLGWMVAHGRLDIRVAFRVHCGSGEPIPFQSVDDGYVHMKWALFADEAGDRIYISGSLNESRTALVLNAENIDVHCDWKGETERLRTDEAEKDFQLLWENRNPAFRVLTLPEAVRQRLVQIAEGVVRPVEIDGSSAAPVTASPPSAMELLRFAVLRDGPRLPGGKRVGMETAPIVPWPHQAIVARRLIASFPASFLLCDEVGLGKTIEAGLAIRSLVLSGLARRVLIAAPASLTQQWQREMATKFFLPFQRALGGKTPRHESLLPCEQETVSNSLYAPDLTIVSTGLLTREDRLGDLRSAQPFDITLVDEAHYARRKNPTEGTRAHPRYGNLYRIIDQELNRKSRGLLLATATPMQLDPIEVSDLLKLSRRVASFQLDPSLTLCFYEILGNLVTGREPSEKEWEFLRKAVCAVEQEDPEHWRFIESCVVDGTFRSAKRQWLEYGQVPRSRDRRKMLRLIFSASPLSRAMLRHTRGLLHVYRDRGQLDGLLAERRILPLTGIQFTEHEKRVYEQLELYCRELARQMSGRRDARGRSAIGFYLSFLRLRFASCLYAIRETVRRRIERVEATLQAQGGVSPEELETLDAEDFLEEGEGDAEVVKAILKDRTPEDLVWEREHLKGMMKNLRDLSVQSSKMTELLRILDHRRLDGGDRIRQTVVFTRFYDTLTDIVERLRQANPRMRIGTYSGIGGQYLNPSSLSMVGTDRDIIKHRFLRGEIDVLVCTDAAAEGLNLQTADFLVNFDLPWNPMKVEQRIGRIDRIGQKNRTIYVSNLCYVGSAEETVYGRLWERLTGAGAVVGTQQISLLPVTREDFQELAENPSFAAKLEKLARERAVLFQRQTASREIPPEELWEIYSRTEQEEARKRAPVGLDDIWDALSGSDHLRELGCVPIHRAEEKVLRIVNVAGVPEDFAVTTSRESFELGIPDLRERLHFATYGEPFFDAILDHFGTFGLPGCIRRVEASISELKAELVGYAVATLDGKGNPTCGLVTSYKDLSGLIIDEKRTLSDEDIAPALQALQRLAAVEFHNHLVIPRLKTENDAIARSQLLLDYLTISGLIRERQHLGKADPLFWREIDAIQEDYKDRDNIRVRQVHADIAVHLTGLLFEVHIPKVGHDAYIDAPQPLLRAAIDSACRVADSMKVKKSELTTNEVVSRIDRLIQQVVKEG